MLLWLWSQGDWLRDIKPVENQGKWGNECKAIITCHPPHMTLVRATVMTRVTWGKREALLCWHVVLPCRLVWMLIVKWEIQEICEAQHLCTVTKWIEGHPLFAFITQYKHTWILVLYSSHEVKRHPFTGTFHFVLLHSLCSSFEPLW